MKQTYSKIFPGWFFIKAVFVFCIFFLVCSLYSNLLVQPVFAAAPTRIVDDNDRVVLKGNVHPLARPEFDAGAVDPAQPMGRMILSLRVNPSKQAELERLLAEQQDPSSPNYHRWLTPEEFGEQFGPDSKDIEVIIDWLTSQGFTIDEVSIATVFLYCSIASSRSPLSKKVFPKLKCAIALSGSSLRAS